MPSPSVHTTATTSGTGQGSPLARALSPSHAWALGAQPGGSRTPPLGSGFGRSSARGARLASSLGARRGPAGTTGTLRRAGTGGNREGRGAAAAT